MWTSEWLAAGYFAFLAAACWLRPVSWRSRLIVVGVAAFEIAAIVAIARGGSPTLRQLAPMVTILIGYYACGLLYVAPSAPVEAWLMSWDRKLLGDPTARFAHWPRPLLAYLEVVYMGTFVVIGAGALILMAAGHGDAIDRYWTLVVGAEFGSFGSLAFVQTRPPWAIERKPMLADPTVHEFATLMTKNLMIGANTFPSGHVAGSLAVAVAVGRVMPAAGVVLLALALSIAVATVVGRYHYAIDAVAGALLTAALWAIMVSFGLSP